LVLAGNPRLESWQGKGKVPTVSKLPTGKKSSEGEVPSQRHTQGKKKKLQGTRPGISDQTRDWDGARGRVENVKDLA